MTRTKKIFWITSIGLVIIVKIFSRFPAAVEKYYSTGIYPLISRLQRLLFGWISISIGDVFYAATALWLLAGLVTLIRRLIRREADGTYFMSVLRRIFLSLIGLYLSFNILWGLNYDRLGIAEQLNLDVQSYTTEELTGLTQLLVSRLNALDTAAHQDREALATHRYLFKGAVQSYGLFAMQDPRFAYHAPSIKPSLFSYLGDYLGFAGYYNPFSGEAQVNTTEPLFSQPYTTCHEMGHQLGYAKENEANFAGYLSAKSSNDPKFRYSAYFDLYLYAARELYMRDSSLQKTIRESLHPAIRQDFRELQAFLKKYRNPMEPYITRLYGGYLKANRQPHGLHTYNEVIAWLIAYYKKNGAAAT